MNNLLRMAALSLLVLTSCAAAPEQKLTLAAEQKSAYSIVISANASPSEQRGAAELRNHLRQLCGAELRVMTDAWPMPANAILVGLSRHTETLGVKLPDDLGNEGFIIKTVGPHVVIAGSPVRGTMYGCTTFLEKLGVRWYTPRITAMPHTPDLVIEPTDEKQTPAFEYREPFFTEAFDKDWAARLKNNGASARLDASTGGKITYYPFVHSFDKLIPRELFKEHPEYFPLIKGKRADGYVQRCLSNPDVLRLGIQAVREWIRANPRAMIYSVSQNDCRSFCECDACKAIEAKYGNTHAGLYLWYVNHIAEAIEKDHPDKLIDTLAYQFTEEPPTGIAPRKNVRVRLCPISVCEAHPYEKCSYKTTVAFVKNLQAWGKITDTLYIWHYNTNFVNYLLPFPDFDEFPADIHLYRRAGVKGIFFQGAYAPGGGGSDAEMRSWVMARLLWNPDQDANALVNEWMAGVYGPAAAPMRLWFDLLHEKVRGPDKHFFIFDRIERVHYITDDVLAEGDRLFDEAVKLAAQQAVALEYVKKARLWLRYAKVMKHPTAGPEFTSFMADVRKLGVTQLREGQPIDAWEKEYLSRVPKK